MKLAPLPIKFANSNANSITISPKEETRVENSAKNLAPTPANTVTKPTKSSNYILPLILVGGGIWYFTK